MKMENTLAFARKMDENDPLATFRDDFLFPKWNERNVIYFTGNSLGLQPKHAKEVLLEELDDWAKYGVEGHFDAKRPWYSYHEQLVPGLCKLTNAKPNEVVAMNSLTTNLHLMMVSFYRPNGKRYKILCEEKAFPSDIYAISSQVRYHGYRPEDAVIEMKPREGEHLIRNEDVLTAIEEKGEEIALVLMGGVNYYTGQLFDMSSITRAAKQKGAIVGFDLAHAIGNVELNLHQWGVDFAVWCSYKYLNSGPGSVGGAFVHESWDTDASIPRFEGWWGTNPQTRFQMKAIFDPAKGANAWQLSNAPVMSMAAHLSALEIFNAVNRTDLLEKSRKLTAYLEFVLESGSDTTGEKHFEIITPREPTQRGCQLSVHAHGRGKELFDKLVANGVSVDWREPNVIRAAPVPLYNSFEDVFEFGRIIHSL